MSLLTNVLCIGVTCHLYRVDGQLGVVGTDGWARNCRVQGVGEQAHQV